MSLKRAKILVFIAGMAAATPGNSQTPKYTAPYSCLVDEVSLEGTLRAARDIAAAKGSATATRDTYTWQPSEVIEFAPGMKLSWVMVYYWPADTGPQRNIPGNQIMLDINFSFVTKNGVIKNGTIFEKPDRSCCIFTGQPVPKKIGIPWRQARAR